MKVLFVTTWILCSLNMALGDQLPVRAEAWRKIRTPLVITSQGSPRHNAQDAITNPGASVEVTGKFVYGKARKDLEGENVSLWLQGRQGWVKAGEAVTDNQGRAAIEAPGYLFKSAGAVDFRFVVGGDLTTAPGKIFVIPPAKRLVVFDIDGTLTIAELEMLGELLGAPTDARPAAATTARLYADAGFQVLYLTGRPNLLIENTRAWLRSNGFPSGAIRTTDRILDGVPSAFLVQRYKREVLQDIAGRTTAQLFAAYGNSATDICAYAQSGIDTRRTFVLGKHAGSACRGRGATQPISGYVSHLPKAREIISER